MSSIYEALKRTQRDRHVASSEDVTEGFRSHRVYWLIIAAILLSSALTMALLYGMGIIGKVPTAGHEVKQPVREDTSRILDLMNKADRLHAKGQMTEAINAYSQVISSNPAFAEAYLKLGSLYYEIKFYDKAFETYTSVKKLKPNDARLLNNMGSVLLAKGDPAKALTFFIQARRCSADYVEPFYNMACAYARLNKNDAALSSLRQACSMQPEARLWARRDPDLASLKGTKEFDDIIHAQ
jgi:tetratricopeptide (TPR) repeat protein